MLVSIDRYLQPLSRLVQESTLKFDCALMTISNRNIAWLKCCSTRQIHRPKTKTKSIRLQHGYLYAFKSTQKLTTHLNKTNGVQHCREIGGQGKPSWIICIAHVFDIVQWKVLEEWLLLETGIFKILFYAIKGDFQASRELWFEIGNRLWETSSSLVAPLT